MPQKKDLESANSPDEPIKGWRTDRLSTNEVLPVPVKTLPDDAEPQYCFVASSGHTIAFHACGSKWQAQVSDKRFSGFSCSYTADVYIERGYGVDQLANEHPAQQASRIHLLPNGKGKTIVYVGSTGLKGGGGRASTPKCSSKCVCTFVCRADGCTPSYDHGKDHKRCLNDWSEKYLKDIEIEISDDEEESKDKSASALAEGKCAGTSSDDSAEETANTSSLRQPSPPGGPSPEDLRKCTVPPAPPPPFIDSYKALLQFYPKSSDNKSPVNILCENSWPVVSSEDANSKDSTVTHSMMDPLKTYLTCSKKMLSLNSLGELPVIASFFQTSSVNRYLENYSRDFSLEQRAAFYKQGGKRIKAKFSAASPEIRQSISRHLNDGGDVYPTIMEQCRASDWLRLQEVAEDPLADPICLKIFLERWEKITKNFNADQQIQLLQALCQAKKTTDLSLAKINGILELIIAAGKTGSNIVHDKPLLDTLLPLKKLWLTSQLANFPRLAASASESSQLVDALATSQLSIAFIQNFLSILEAEESVDDLSELLALVEESAALDFISSSTFEETGIIPSSRANRPQLWMALNLSELLEFLVLVKGKAIPEVVLLSTLRESETSPASQVSKPLRWIQSLMCQLLTVPIARADATVADGVAAALFRKIQQNRSVAACIEHFISNNLELVVSNSVAFISVLNLLYMYQVGETICAAVFERLLTEPPQKWANAADQVIVSRLFRSRPEFTVTELIQQIAQCSPAVLYDPLAVSAASCHLGDITLETVYKHQVAEALMPRILSEFEEVSSTLRISLEQVRSDVISIQNEKDINFDLKELYDLTLPIIEGKEKLIETRLNEIGKERENNLKKETGKEAELGQDKVKLKEKLYAGDDEKRPKATLNLEQPKTEETLLKECFRALRNEKENLEIELGTSKSNHFKALAPLEIPRESFQESIEKIEACKISMQEKTREPGRKNATFFSDHVYEFTLKKWIDGIKDCESAASSLLKEEPTILLPFKSKKICDWNKQEIHAWSTHVRRQIQFSDCFSRSILELIAVIKRALHVVEVPLPSHEQLFQLLTLLFPLPKGPQTPITDPLVVAMLAAISAMYSGQVSLITDSKQLPLSKIKVKQYLSFFNLLNVTAIEKINWKGNHAATVKNQIVYGTLLDFQNLGSNLIAFDELKEMLHAVNERCGASSAILQAADTALVVPRGKVISGWDEQAVSQWATYLQNTAPSYHAYSLEYLAVVKHAATLAFEKPPTSSQLWALFISLDGNLDKAQLTQQDQKDILVVAMCMAVNGLQTKLYDVSAIRSQLPASSAKQYLRFFSMLKLQVDSSSDQLSSNAPISEKCVKITQSPHPPTSNNASTLVTQGVVDSPCDFKHMTVPFTSFDSEEIDTQDLAVKKSNRNYTLLEQAFAAVEAAYRGPSTLFQDVCSGFKAIPIAEWNKAQLSVWAKKVVTMTELNLLNKAELIAVVKRTVKLTHGFAPRDVQLLALLTLLSESGKGCLAQVNTGEGKSLIVAMLAAFHALQGKQVDVVTTSTELSIPEVEKQKQFFSSLELTVAENSRNSNKKAVYESNVVYGTSADFQGDILRTESCGDNVRGCRRHDVVIVDEVDSLLFDNRSHSVRLSATNPGMQHVTLLLTTIWHHAQQIVRHMLECDGQTYFIAEDFERRGTDIQLASGAEWKDTAHLVSNKRLFITDKMTEFLENSLRTLDGQEKQEYVHYRNKYYAFITLEQEFETATDHKKKQDLRAKCERLGQELEKLPWNLRHSIIEIPEHLRSFMKQQIPLYIKHCLDALYVYKKDAHYTVHQNRIIPIQFNETGMLEASMVWSDGLTQFLQMKESLPVDPEGFSTTFISNTGFFKRYGNAIYGLTGTLGGPATQDFLSELYNVDFVIIPPHKCMVIEDNYHSPYLCKELAPIIVDNASWYAAIVQQTLHHAKQQRAVLVICQFIYQVDDLAALLRALYDSYKVFTYTGEEAAFTKEVVNSGEVIISTYIAGRGTDLKPSSSVEDNGGLYVAVTTLPESYRVELQNVGRTARAGNKGMAQLILCNEGGATIECLKANRNQQEQASSEMAKAVAKKMLLQDALFQNFNRLEAKYLPGALDCENLRTYEVLAPQWKAYASRKGSDDSIAKKFKSWKSSGENTWYEQAERSGLDSNDQKCQGAEFAQKLACEEENYKKQYKNKLSERFSRGQTLPSEVWTRLLGDIPFTISMPKLSKKFNWGIFERKALEERWALWIKSKRIDECTKVLPLFEKFENEFSPSIDKDAKRDCLVENLYFYVLKGNHFSNKQDLEQATEYYKRAISLDPTFRVEALYNEASTLLTFSENEGERQRKAEEALEYADEIIKTDYRPRLLRFFHSLTTPSKVQTHSLQHIQYQLNIIEKLEDYIQKAREVLQTTRKEKHHVKLSVKLIKDAFDGVVDNDFDKAIKEFNNNGLTHLFVLEEITPTPWWSISAVAIIGVLQVVAGFLLYPVGVLGHTLIAEGVSDLITAAISAITGSFSWAVWGIQKGISCSLSICTAGLATIKNSYTALKSLFKSTGSIILESLGEATKLFSSQLSAQSARASISQAGQRASKLIRGHCQKLIMTRIEEALTKSLGGNSLVIQALELDKKRGNSRWLQVFAQEGQQLLADKNPSDPRLTQMADEIAGNVTGFYKLSRLLIFAELSSGMDNFVKMFNERVESYKEAILADQREVEETVTISDDVTTQSAAFNMALEENDIPVDQVSSSTHYTSKLVADPELLATHFGNQGPSTAKNLVSLFNRQINEPALPCVKKNYSAGRLFKQLDEAGAKFLAMSKKNQPTNSLTSQTCKRNQTTQPSTETGEVQTLTRVKKASASRSPLAASKLIVETEWWKESFQKDGANDIITLVPLAAVTCRNVEIFNVEGDRMLIVKHQNKGCEHQSVKLVFEPVKTGLRGNYRPLDPRQVKNPNYQSSLTESYRLQDVILAHLPPEELDQLGGRKGVIQKGADYINAHPEGFSRFLSNTQSQHALRLPYLQFQLLF